MFPTIHPTTYGIGKDKPFYLKISKVFAICTLLSLTIRSKSQNNEAIVKTFCGLRNKTHISTCLRSQNEAEI